MQVNGANDVLVVYIVVGEICVSLFFSIGRKEWGGGVYNTRLIHCETNRDVIRPISQSSFFLSLFFLELLDWRRTAKSSKAR